MDPAAQSDVAVRDAVEAARRRTRHHRDQQADDDLAVSEVQTLPAFKIASWTVLIYGLGGCLLVAYPTLLTHLPIVGPRLQRSLVSRFTGHREAAAELQQTLATISTPDGRPPVI